MKKNIENELNSQIEEELDSLDELIEEELKVNSDNLEIQSSPEIQKTQNDKVEEHKNKPLNVDTKYSAVTTEQNNSKTKYSFIREYLNEAKICFMQRKFKKALMNYQKVLDIENKNLTALFNIGVIYLEQEEQELAVKKFQEVLEIKPDDYKSLCNIGGIYYKMGRLKEAYEILNRAVAVNPNDVNSLENLKLIEQKINK